MRNHQEVTIAHLHEEQQDTEEEIGSLYLQVFFHTSLEFLYYLNQTCLLAYTLFFYFIVHDGEYLSLNFINIFLYHKIKKVPEIGNCP